MPSNVLESFDLKKSVENFKSEILFFKLFATEIVPFEFFQNKCLKGERPILQANMY